MYRIYSGIVITLCIPLLAAHLHVHEVTYGKADIVTLEHLVQITTSDKSIIHWQEFSSGTDDIIRFVQPSCEAAVLNRVIGGNPSTLYGRLEANGQIFLVNPNGIIIGKDAYVDAGAFLASTFDVLNEEFLEGKSFSFSGDSQAGVVNLGKIKTGYGDVTLIGYQVENDGTIDAAGKMVAVACRKVIVKPQDHQRIFIAAEADLPLEESLENPYLLAFRQTVQQDALHFKKDDTGVFLTIDHPVASIAGPIHADSVAVFGEQIQILQGADIDVSREGGGGEILIGGDFQGQNPEIPHSRQLFLSEESKLSADAIENGTGGRIICWSNRETICHAHLSARGGVQGGDGGLVEVSGKGYLDYQGIADLRPFVGELGTLLLDPSDLTIMPGAGATAGGTFSGGNPNTFTPNATPSTIFATTIQMNLAGASVIINSGSAGDGIAGTGDITIAGAITMPLASGNLTFNAFRNLTLNQILTNNSATGNLNLNAGNTVAGSLGTLAINANIVHGNSVLMRSLTLTANNGITIGGTITTGNTMDFTINQTGNGGITILRSILIGGAAGNLTIQSAGGSILLNQQANPLANAVGVGSRNGTTWINAPNCDLFLRAHDMVNTGYAQLGFDPATTGAPANPVTGPIRVDCRNLTLTGGDNTTNASPAVIGHGALGTNGSAPLNAAITINCGGQITMTGANNNNGPARIGHGPIAQQAGAGISGDITVASVGDVIMSANGVGGQSLGCAIGHFPTSNAPPMPIALSGNIALTTNGNLTLTSLTTVNGGHTVIGHGIRNSGTTIQGNIDVRCQNLGGGITVRL